MDNEDERMEKVIHSLCDVKYETTTKHIAIIRCSFWKIFMTKYNNVSMQIIMSYKLHQRFIYMSIW